MPSFTALAALFPKLPKTDLCETTEFSPPLEKRLPESITNWIYYSNLDIPPIGYLKQPIGDIIYHWLFAYVIPLVCSRTSKY